MKYALTFLALVNFTFLVAPPASSQTPPPHPPQLPPVSTEKIGLMVSRYFEKPMPDQIPGLIVLIDKNHLPSAMNRGALLGFFLELFHDNPAKRAEWEADGNATTGPTLDFFKSLIGKSENLENRPELKIDTEDPSDNDFCWGAFYASGDEKYLQVLVQRLGLIQDQKSRMRYAVGASAEWSLASNALTHPKVRAFLVKELNAPLPPNIHDAVQASLTKTPINLEREMVKGLRKFATAPKG